MLRVKAHARVYALFLISTTLLFIGVGCLPKARLILPDGTVIHPAIAKTEHVQRVGLSGVDDVKDGMLFCFSEARVQKFWMLDMHVPLDFIWLDGDDVKGFASDVPIREGGDWARRQSPEPVYAVLELPAGWISAHAIEMASSLPGAARACSR